jgi:hypothetical protein
VRDENIYQAYINNFIFGRQKMNRKPHGNGPEKDDFAEGSIGNGNG